MKCVKRAINRFRKETVINVHKVLVLELPPPMIKLVELAFRALNKTFLSKLNVLNLFNPLVQL